MARQARHAGCPLPARRHQRRDRTPARVGETWFAVFAPGGTPKPVIDKLGTALRKITASASFGEAMRKLGNEAKTSTPAELREVTLQQSKSWGDLIRRLNIKAE